MIRLGVLFLCLLPLLLPAQSMGDFFQYELDGKSFDLYSYMEQQHIPSLSLYARYGDRDTVFTIGQADRAGNRPATAATTYSVGSMAQAPLNFLVCHLASKGRIDLDAPVNGYLRTWKVPKTPATRRQPVTVRDLLLMRRGFNTDQKPKGYLSGTPLPTFNQVLLGERPASNPAISVRRSKNKKGNSEYANALVLQQLLEDVYELPLAELVEKHLFDPLGMQHSYYATELSEAQSKQAALGYDTQGQPIPGGYYRYPELGAAGLWTTPSDYAKLVAHVIAAAKEQDNRLLNPEIARAALTRSKSHRSLIFNVDKNGLIYWGGNNKGYFTAMQANLQDDYIMVAMSNSDLNWRFVMGTLWQTGSWIATQRSGAEAILWLDPQADSAFASTLLPRLRNYCREAAIDLQIRQPINGVPGELTATPALVLQTHRGRSIFGGDPNTFSALTNFLRTNRFRPIPNQTEQRSDILVQQNGRFRTVLPLKVTSVNGDFNPSVTPETLRGQLAEALSQESSFCFQSEVALTPTDRRFYWDVHPFVADNGTLYLSMALFSQFDCVHPIANNFDQPLSGRTLPQLTRAAARLLLEWMREVAVLPQPIAELPVADWDALGLSLPPAPSEEVASASAGNLPQVWSQPRALATGLPLVQFNFPSPLERYAGELSGLSGQLTLSEDQQAISGSFTADVSTLTMGMDGLDEKVLKQYLKVQRFPTASFRFESAALPEAIEWGKTTRLMVPGTFEMVGNKIPIDCTTELRPVVGADGLGRLEVQVSFRLNINSPFGLPGPDGPKEAKRFLDFGLQFQLQA